MKALLELPPETPGEKHSIYRGANGRYHVQIELKPPFVAIEETGVDLDDWDDSNPTGELPHFDGGPTLSTLKPGAKP